jgi:hypothetical protein
MQRARLRLGLAVTAVLAAAVPTQATTLLQFSLKDLATRSDLVFRGTVLSAKPGTVKAGGGELPTVTYRVQVDETFKGEYPAPKNDRTLVEIRMVGSGKATRSNGAVQHFSVFRDVPRLEVGREYVLFTTPRSELGLSTTVGLGQGTFQILGGGKEEQAVNLFNNRGLNRGMADTRVPSRGPVAYDQLAAAIRAVLSE